MDTPRLVCIIRLLQILWKHLGIKWAALYVFGQFTDSTIMMRKRKASNWIFEASENIVCDFSEMGRRRGREDHLTILAISALLLWREDRDGLLKVKQKSNTLPTFPRCRKLYSYLSFPADSPVFFGWTCRSVHHGWYSGRFLPTSRKHTWKNHRKDWPKNPSIPIG